MIKRRERPPHARRGAVMAEYILMAGLIAIAAMAAAGRLGPIVMERLRNATAALASAPTQGGGGATNAP